jgi:plastocyanin
MASSTIDLRIATAAASRRPRSRVVLRIAIVAVAAAIAAALALLPDPAKAASSPVVIKMTDTQPFYTPAKIAIRAGETVQWVNSGTTVHSVSTTLANAERPGDTSMPKGAQAFDSGFIPPGGDYSYTFTVPGTYRYFCLPHEKAGMVGVIVVKK